MFQEKKLHICKVHFFIMLVEQGTDKQMKAQTGKRVQQSLEMVACKKLNDYNSACNYHK